jgi:hypothetical protein
VYESTFLQAVSAFETFQEELFFSSLLRKAGVRGVVPLVSFRNRSEAERVLLAGEKRAFLSWSNMRENISRAETYLVGGRPFSRLRRRGKDLAVLETVTRVRNAVAHTSGTAVERFKSLSMGGLAPRKRTPAGYLQWATGNATQHETLVDEIERLAKALAATSDRAARALLRDEDPYKSGAEVERGTYECISCRTRISPARVGSLPPCSNCNLGPCPHCGSMRASAYARIHR